MTLADLMARLAEIHGDRTFVTEELEPGALRSLTYLEAARQVEKWSAAIAARSEPGLPVVVATANASTNAADA